MFPILLDFGPLTLYTYGLFVGLGIFVGIKVAVHLACRENFDRKVVEESFFRLSFYLVIPALLGGRIGYVLTYWGEFKHNIGEILKVWHGGLVFYWALLGASIGFLIWNRRSASSLIFGWRKIVDWFAPSLAFGHALGRLGCFFAGCCYGVPIENLWGVTFSHPHSLVPWELREVPLHPTQIYEFVLLNFLGVFLLWRVKNRSSSSKIDGVVFADYLALYSFGRFLVEFFRGDQREFFGLTVGQITAILVFVASIFFRLYLRIKSSSSPLFQNGMKGDQRR